MYLEKLDRDCLEDMLSDILTELRENNHVEMADKYYDMIMEKMYGIDTIEAQSIVESMQPYGEVYTMDDVAQTMRQHNTPMEEILHYYMCMNMFNNDYRRYPESKRLDVKDFCFVMSEMFINDEDAPDYKVERYFKPVD